MMRENLLFLSVFVMLKQRLKNVNSSEFLISDLLPSINVYRLFLVLVNSVVYKNYAVIALMQTISHT